MALITIREYMEQRRKAIDRYVEGEHKWLGDTHATVDVSQYISHTLVLQRRTTCFKMTVVFRVMV